MDQGQSDNSPVNISVNMSDSILAESEELISNYNKLIRRSKANDLKVIISSIGSSNQNQLKV